MDQERIIKKFLKEKGVSIYIYDNPSFVSVFKEQCEKAYGKVIASSDKTDYFDFLANYLTTNLSVVNENLISITRNNDNVDILEEYEVITDLNLTYRKKEWYKQPNEVDNAVYKQISRYYDQTGIELVRDFETKTKDGSVSSIRVERNDDIGSATIIKLLPRNSDEPYVKKIPGDDISMLNFNAASLNPENGEIFDYFTLDDTDKKAYHNLVLGKINSIKSTEKRIVLFEAAKYNGLTNDPLYGNIKAPQKVYNQKATGGYSGIALVGVLSSIATIIMAMIGIGIISFLK